MKTAVVFFSLEGNTKFAAAKIAKRLGADLIELKPVKAYPTKGASKFFHGGKSATFKEKPELEKYEFIAENYDTVVIGSPLWAWKITPPIRTFLAEQDLSGKKIAVFMSCGGGNTAKAIESLRTESKADKLIAQLTVVNPLQNGESTEKAIEQFCQEIESAKEA